MKIIILISLFYFVNCQDIDVGNAINCMNENCQSENVNFLDFYNKQRLLKCLHCVRGPYVLLTDEEKEWYENCMNADECEIHEDLAKKFQFKSELIDFAMCMRSNCNVDFENMSIRPFIQKHRSLAYLQTNNIYD